MDEIVTAIGGLSSADRTRLDRFAAWRMRGVGGRRIDVEPQDLLHEAIAMTLDGRRTWNRRVDIVKHLIETMRSVSSHMRERRAAECEALSVLDRERPADDPSQRVHDRQVILSIERELADDELALDILGGLYLGMTGPDIARELGITRCEYETSLKGIRRKMRKKFGAANGC